MRQIIGMLLYSCKSRNIFEENTHPLKRGQYLAKLQLIFKTANLQNVTENIFSVKKIVPLFILSGDFKRTEFGRSEAYTRCPLPKSLFAETRLKKKKKKSFDAVAERSGASQGQWCSQMANKIP